MDHIQVVIKLIGPIAPVGETELDSERFENLKAQCEVVEALIMGLQHVANTCKDRYEFSVKRAGEYANRFLENTIGIQQD
jgi:hypothetical protein